MSGNETFPILPWENRSSIPIWRGSPWAHVPQTVTKEANSSTVLDQLVRNARKIQRVRAVVFSYEHPDLLNAKFSGDRGLPAELLKWNATNGLHKLLPFNKIPKGKFYTEYQVAVVLGGVGAAFRTAIHLSTGTAIVLQKYVYEEWFTRFMKPFVHYIPLAEDLSDIGETMHWVRDNPDKVREIAERGQEFYEQYLSFERQQDMYYELLYRLALKTKNTETN